MSELSNCPYPGLRPFNEEESIFFKGRDEHIEQIIKQLEEKKFLMLTGASGDGKSSLVYAGVIPNARAGFFKAKFNNWIVADFRPEREPLKNLAVSLSKHLKLADADKTEKELSYGFSALIDCYKSTPYWVDQQSESFKTLTEDEQKKAKRKGANLLILADQFEEFFTNPENYINGKASIESQTVVNLLLETTRLAIEQNIPIYIVCTMRSDYIGQCAAFRGLPEYIGYSQFFVPRLKRKEIYQVIEEPALLNGNKISKRLVEMLINEMNDGIDQLPVLQHALNQIWQNADFGREEMDLIHFAKVCGVPKNQLREKDRQEFENWFSTLPDFKKSYFENASLENVLDAHANELFEHAAKNANEKAGKELITAEDAKLIIEVTFKCLTKIDESRAVRNRMTLEEVTNIINRPSITEKEVASVIEVFRKQGNTFLKPFIEFNGGNEQIYGNSVLDITHESLIRNWKLLSEWAKQEYESYTVYLDFSKQLQRWLDNKKSSDYLLPIGPLTFFENWFLQAKPNKYWLARYDESETSKEEKLVEAEQRIKDIKAFIKRSARSLFVSRTVMKYGANNIIAVFGILLFLFSCTYFYFDYRKKQNEYVINKLKNRGEELLSSNIVRTKEKAMFIVNLERLTNGIAEKKLNALNNDTLAYDIAFEIFTNIQNYNDELEIPNLKFTNRLFYYMDSLIKVKIDLKTNKIKDNKNPTNFMTRVLKHTLMLTYIIKNDSSKILEKAWKINLDFLKNYWCNNLDALNDNNISLFYNSIKILLSTKTIAESDIKKILNTFSPFEKSSNVRFKKTFNKNKKFNIGNDTYISYAGGYQLMAYLYVAINDKINLNRSIDSLLTTESNYKDFYVEGIQDIYNIMMLYQDFPSTDFESIYLRYNQKIKKDFTVENYYSNFIDLIQSNNFNFNFSFDVQKDYMTRSLSELFIHDSVISKVLLKNKNKIELKFKDFNERNYQLAIFYKKLSYYYINTKKNHVIGLDYLNKSIDYYNLIDVNFLTKNVIFYNNKYEVIKDVEQISYEAAFLYPGLINELGKNLYTLYIYSINGMYYFNGNEQFSASGLYFLDFLKNKNLINFKSSNLIKSFENYLYNGLNKYFNSNSDSFKTKTIKTLDYLVNQFSNNNTNGFDKNFMSLLKLKLAIENQDTANYLRLSQTINIDEVTKESFQKFDNTKGEVHKALLKDYFKLLAVSNQKAKAFKVLNSISQPWDRRNLLIDVSYDLMTKNDYTNMFTYIDSLLVQIKIKPKFGMKFFRLLGNIGGSKITKIRDNIYKDFDDKCKPRALMNYIQGLAESGKYYKAYEKIPKDISQYNEMDLINKIIIAEVQSNKPDKNWKKYDFSNYGLMIRQNNEVEGEHFDNFAD